MSIIIAYKDMQALKPKSEVLDNGDIVKKGYMRGTGSSGTTGGGGSSGGSGAPQASFWSYLHQSIYGFYHYFGVNEVVINWNGKDYPSINRCQMWVVDSTNLTFNDFDDVFAYVNANNPTFTNTTTYNGTVLNPARPHYRFIDTDLNTNRFYSAIWRVRFVASDNTTIEFTWTPNEYILPSKLNINYSASYSSANDTFTFSNTSNNSRRIVEFNRPSYTPYNTYTQEQKDVMYDSTVRNQEFGIWGDAFDTDYSKNRFTAWNNATIIIKVIHNASTNTIMRDAYNTAINNWITLQNNTISGSGVTFSRNDSSSNPHFTVRTGTHLEMFGFNPTDYYYGGTWQTWANSNGFIYQAEVKLNNQLEHLFFTSVNAITTEEMMQACGCGGDLVTRADCINTDFNWKGKNPTGGYNAIDTACNKIIYNTDLRIKAAGQYPEALAVLLNPTRGFMSTGGTTRQALWLKPNTTYNFRTYEVNANNSIIKATSFTSFTTGNTTLPLGNPLNILVSQLNYETNVQITYTWGSNATGMDIQWSNDQANWNNFTNQQQNNYPSINYTINVSTYGDKYFRVRSRRVWGDGEKLSSWFQATPYPIGVIEVPLFGLIYVVVNGVFVEKPVYYHNGTAWVQGDVIKD